jgi:RNA polymerase sigma factor (sigma-70 family)
MHTSASAIAESRRPHAGKLSQATLLHQSDERLVALARSGSERAWTEITRRYGRQLRVYCTRFVGTSRAEDAVQQTFLQAFLALRDGNHREIVLRAWLYRIAHNCSIDLLRKGSTDYEELDLEHDGVAQPPTLFEQREEIRRIVARMRDLPEAQRQALALRELEGRSYEEISEQLGHSGSGVRQLIFRARTALRNSAAGFLPLGSHHVATAVSVPASSGTGMDAVGAATLAAVAVLGGGFAVADGSHRRARPAQAKPARVAPPPAAAPAGVGAQAPATPTAKSNAFSVRIPGRHGPARDAVPAEPVVSGLLPPTPPAPAAAPAVTPAPDDAPASAPAASPPAGDDVGQRSSGPGTGTTSPVPAAPGPPGSAGTPASAPTVTAPVAAKPPVPAGSTQPTPPKTSPSKTPPSKVLPPSAPAARKPSNGAPVKPPAKPLPPKPQPKSPSRTGGRG